MEASVQWMVIKAEYRSNDLIAALRDGFEPFAVSTLYGTEFVWLRRAIEHALPGQA